MSSVWESAVAEHQTRDQEVASSIPSHCVNDSGHVVHTHVPLPPSSIIWYQ